MTTYRDHLTNAQSNPESFLVFSQAIPSQALGIIDSKASKLELTVAGRDLSIHQSPTLLSSNRKEGTTGAGLLSNPVVLTLAVFTNH